MAAHVVNYRILPALIPLLIILLAQLPPSAALEATRGQTETLCSAVYTVQADDWLSKIADKFLGDGLAYPAILEATNQHHASDPTFAQIANPDVIEVGWQLCIPTGEWAGALLAETSAPAALEPADLVVFAAASLTESFTEIGQNFETIYPGVTVSFNFAGSQQLVQQLGHGAPADLFASANNAQMTAAIGSGRVISGTQQTFARNRLTVIYPVDNPAGISQLQDLAKPNLRLILAASEVPVGRYSLEFLDRSVQDAAFGAVFKDKVLGNVVSYEPNVKVVLTKIALGEGDAGIIYTSDITPDVVDQVGQLEIPAALNTIATYPIAVVDDSNYTTQATTFMAYILSPAGQEVLARYGFISNPGYVTGTP